MSEALQTQNIVAVTAGLEQSLEFESIVAHLSDAVKQQSEDADRFIAPAKTQLLNHLQHISLQFTVRADSTDYVHAQVLDGPLPHDATKRIVRKANAFLDYADLGATPDIQTPFLENEQIVEQRIHELKQQELEHKRYVVGNPKEAYERYTQRLQNDGFEATFPEFLSTLELLDIHMLTNAELQQACLESQFIASWREDVLKHLIAAQKEARYHESIFAVESALELLDVVSRGTKLDVPELYHSGRYEYYFHYLVQQKDHIFYPTTASLGASDLIKVRGVPIGFVGVNMQDSWVDGFTQTPYEFFHHDVNHSRRMYQFLTEDAAKKNMSIAQYATASSEFVTTTLQPLLQHKRDGHQDPALRMLLFEILHEDALPASPDVIERALFRQPLERTPFEKMHDNEVQYLMEEGATTLSYVYRKLGHTFYDRPDSRYSFLGDKDDRSRLAIVDAAAIVLQAVSGREPSEEELLMFEQLTVTDRGFPAAFFEEVKKDIQARVGKDGTDFGFLVSEPIGAKEAIERIRGVAKGIVHSLFGYSAMGYQQPNQMLQLVEHDLYTLDPNTTSILIGATKEGIGASYEVAKKLGFHTLGLVSSKSIVYGGEYSPFVDEIIIVEDTSWGGLNKEGKPTPTTEAFIGASDYIASYGGGLITKATLKLARARGTTTKSVYLAPAS